MRFVYNKYIAYYVSHNICVEDDKAHDSGTMRISIKLYGFTHSTFYCRILRINILIKTKFRGPECVLFYEKWLTFINHGHVRAHFVR